MIRIWWALAKGVLLESLRRKDLWVVAIVGFVILIASASLGRVGTKGLEVFAKDLGISALGFLSTIIAVLISTRQVPEEISRKTVYPLLARPIRRADFLIGKLFGACLATWCGFALLSVTIACGLAIFGVKFEPILLQYLLLKGMGLAVVCSFSMALSTLMTTNAAVTTSLILAFGSSIIVRALTLMYASASAPMQAFFKTINALLPQVSLFDIGSRASNVGWAPVPVWVVGFLFAYACAYCGAMFGVSWLRFRRKTI